MRVLSTAGKFLCVRCCAGLPDIELEKRLGDGRDYARETGVSFSWGEIILSKYSSWIVVFSLPGPSSVCFSTLQMHSILGINIYSLFMNVSYSQGIGCANPIMGIVLLVSW